MDKNKRRILISIVLNSLLVIMEIIGLIICLVNNHGLSTQFYTEDSNNFALIVSIIFLVYLIISFKTGKKIPLAVSILKYTSVCCLALTFVVVITILAPSGGLEGYRHALFDDSLLYHHFLCPVLAIISYIFFDNASRTKIHYSLYALIPTIIYAIVAIILNVLKVMKGPYAFLLVYEQPVYMSFIWFFIVVGLAYLLCFLILFANNKYIDRINTQEN